MTREDRMIKSHIESLSACHSEKIFLSFSKPKLEGDSVTSISESKKIAHITRHLLTSEPTHSIILKDEFFDRV